MPPVAPMLAKAVDQMPVGDGMIYEPKWDGFRCIVFRDGDEVAARQPQRAPAHPLLPRADRAAAGVAAARDASSTARWSSRPPTDSTSTPCSSASTRPQSRVTRLSVETPASFVAFDLLALDDRRCSTRRCASDGRCSNRRWPRPTAAHPPVADDPRRRLAADWFVRFEGAGLDGVMAKPADGTYEQNKRVQFKVKHRRTADCVVGGLPHAQGRRRRGLVAARACSTTTSGCTTSGWRRASPPGAARSCWASSRSTWSTRSRTTRGGRGPRRRPTSSPARRGCPAPSAAGTPRRT